MSIDVRQTALMAQLEKNNPTYFGKALELRETVENWLAYIPHTFPHYTRHTIQHSEGIIRQLSQLLFTEGDPDRPVLENLSSLESYLLIVASYLHDSGMVASDKEKARILASSEWKTWTSGSGGGAKRWKELEAFRLESPPPDNAVRQFIADIQVRHLIAEFIRRNHHLRAADVISHHQEYFGRFAFDDPTLTRTIADICVAHGLRQHELEDNERYPHRRDVRGETANVRLMANLLRIGDLLDMDHDRACPLLLNAACPLPAESLAHWTQYQRFTHRLSAPDRIELVAECVNQEEHRYIRDWSQWLVAELNEARRVMASAPRHAGWQPPLASLDGPSPTIVIKAAAGAEYIPADWVFELDNDAIFERLIHDTYAGRDIFIRELIQNAADATRCQLYADLAKKHVKGPEYPTYVDEDQRKQYPIRISLGTTKKLNSLSGETETRQVLTVDDVGIGMDEEVILRYLLQVGRSYYTTAEFRRNFAFAPTSRFGIGFLSVFMASDEVTIETYKPTSQHAPEPIRLRLTGPRSYLLTEHGERARSGTRIDVVLREPMAPGHLTELVSHWCRRLEFPVIVNDLGEQSTIKAEKPDHFVSEVRDVFEEKARFVIRWFPVNREGIEGELYVFARVSESGESWVSSGWARHTYLPKHPQATIPEMPGDLICFQGINTQDNVGYALSGQDTVARLDIRGAAFRPTVSRGRLSGGFPPSLKAAIESRWDEILSVHLADSARAKGPNCWKYKQRLVSRIGSSAFWLREPETFLLYENGQERRLSLAEVLKLPHLVVISSSKHLFSMIDSSDDQEEFDPSVIVDWGIDSPTLLERDLKLVSEQHLGIVFSTTSVVYVRFAPDGQLMYGWSTGLNEPLFAEHRHSRMARVELPSKQTLATRTHSTGKSYENHILLNEDHPIVKWLVKVKAACSQGSHGLNREHFNKLVSLLEMPAKYLGHEYENLQEYLDGWKEIPDLPGDLYPPHMEITAEMFHLQKTTESQSEEQSR